MQFPFGKGSFPPWGGGTAGRFGHCLRRWPQRLRRARSPISTLREAVPMYASAQPLDFLARTKNASYPNRKLQVSQPVSFDVEKPGGH